MLHCALDRRATFSMGTVVARRRREQYVALVVGLSVKVGYLYFSLNGH